jgi:hypothetical protein
MDLGRPAGGRKASNKMGKSNLIELQPKHNSPAKQHLAEPLEASHDPKVAGSNPAPAIRTEFTGNRGVRETGGLDA